MISTRAAGRWISAYRITRALSSLYRTIRSRVMGEMIVSKRMLVKRIQGVYPGMAGVYDAVLEMDFDWDKVMDTLEEIREWVMGCIYSE